MTRSDRDYSSNSLSCAPTQQPLSTNQLNARMTTPRPHLPTKMMPKKLFQSTLKTLRKHPLISKKILLITQVNRISRFPSLKLPKSSLRCKTNLPNICQTLTKLYQKNLIRFTVILKTEKSQSFWSYFCRQNFEQRLRVKMMLRLS